MADARGVQIQSGIDPAWLGQALALRQAVFVHEQGVPAELEQDEFERSSLQFLAVRDGVPVATARIRRTSSGAKFERFAVAMEQRGRGIGAQLARAMWAAVEPETPIYMHAQLQASEFWKRQGFVEAGPVFDEAGIPHQRLQAPNRSPERSSSLK